MTFWKKDTCFWAGLKSSPNRPPASRTSLTALWLRWAALEPRVGWNLLRKWPAVWATATQREACKKMELGSEGCCCAKGIWHEVGGVWIYGYKWKTTRLPCSLVPSICNSNASKTVLLINIEFALAEANIAPDTTIFRGYVCFREGICIQ